MNITFLGGVTRAAAIEGLKLGELPRVAFAGRSNVGKSTLLNALTGSKAARVSSTPGKTREMNFFRWDPQSRIAKKPSGRAWILVDLPGYGYAKVAGSLRAQWGREIARWLDGDEFLRLVVALVDGRHGYLESDLELVEWLLASRLPFVVAFTKMDKWKSSNQRRQAERQLVEASAKAGVEQFIFVSAISREGIRPLKEKLEEISGVR